MTKIWFGGDYNPEQWPDQARTRDRELLAQAGIDTVTLGIFSWTRWHPGPEVYDFSELDTMIDQVSRSGLKIILATPTAARPAWLAAQYPEVNRVDFDGRQHRFGGRANACPSSPVYRSEATEIAGRLAQRYTHLPNLLLWHVGNEYGGVCYCDRCAAAFREWLQTKYGTLAELNRRWYTSFWSHTFTAWDEIWPSSALTEQTAGPNRTNFQAITLDYQRFSSDALLQCYKIERDAIRAHSADVPITTNFMGGHKPLDYFAWAREMDLVSWDSYPQDERSQAKVAMWHDLMRGLCAGAPFWLMEQTPTVTSWADANPIKRPGVMRLWSYQAIAHGSDAVLFFQLRQSRGASAKMHGAVIGHAGRDDTRSFREVSDLGDELSRLGGEIVGARAQRGRDDLRLGRVVGAGDVRRPVAARVLPRHHDQLVRRAAPTQRLGRPGAPRRGAVRLPGPAGPDAVPGSRRAGRTRGNGRARGRSLRHRDPVGRGGRRRPGVPHRRSRSVRRAVRRPGRRDRRSGARPEQRRRDAGRNSARLFAGVRPGPGHHRGGGRPLRRGLLRRHRCGHASSGRGGAGLVRGFAVGRRRDGLAAREVVGAAGVDAVICGATFPVEATERHRDDARYLFLLNHATVPSVVVSDRDGTSLLDGEPVSRGQSLELPGRGVMIIKTAGAG